jgi:hypothetical protein
MIKSFTTIIEDLYKTVLSPQEYIERYGDESKRGNVLSVQIVPPKIGEGFGKFIVTHRYPVYPHERK